MSIQLDREITQDLERASRLEWLETNGLGGWAGTTVAGLNSRRDHGLLVAASQAGHRTVLLSRLDETIHVAGGSFDLGCNQFPGAVAPQGFQHLVSFTRDLFPTFEYEAAGVRLRKTVAAVDGENTTLVLYEVLEAPGPFLLSLRPFLAGRDQHALTSAGSQPSPETAFEDGVLRLRASSEMPEAFVLVPGADFQANPHWWYRFEYEADRRRGFDFQEDLWTPGLFGRELAPGDRLGVIVSTRSPAGRDAFVLFDKERRRREKVLQGMPSEDNLLRLLRLAADSFLVRRGAQQRTVIAGYPWYSERSRDTLMALPGLCLVTGRHDDARRILRTYAKAVSKGMIPDRLPERGEQPSYTSADTSLWLFVDAWKLLQATGDEGFVRETLLPVLRKVIHAYTRGTRNGIGADTDGLLRSGEGEKTVEANALWYNALATLAEIETRLGDPVEGNHLVKQAKKVQKSFQEAFWSEEDGYLADRDRTLRPGQVLALSLPFTPLPKARAARALAALEERLYTPVGLRTDSERGTVQPWLLGPYLTAQVRVNGAAGRKKARQALAALEPRLAEAGIGLLSEVYGAEPPHSPAGCIASALSVAEVLRAYVEDVQGGPAPKTGRGGRTRSATPVP